MRLETIYLNLVAIFITNLGQTFFLAVPVDHSVKLCDKVFMISKPSSSKPFLIDYVNLKHQTLDQIGCFKMTKNQFNGPYVDMVLRQIPSPLEAKKTFACIHCIGHFSQHNEL